MDGFVVVDGLTGRVWMCKREGGHALGLRVKAQRGGLSVERLLLFRDALPLERVGEARGTGLVEGTMHDIVCSVCGARRTWWMSENGKRLLARMYLAE